MTAGGEEILTAELEQIPRLIARHVERLYERRTHPLFVRCMFSSARLNPRFGRLDRALFVVGLRRCIERGELTDAEAVDLTPRMTTSLSFRRMEEKMVLDERPLGPDIDRDLEFGAAAREDWIREGIPGGAAWRGAEPPRRAAVARCSAAVTTPRRRRAVVCLSNRLRPDRHVQGAVQPMTDPTYGAEFAVSIPDPKLEFEPRLQAHGGPARARFGGPGPVRSGSGAFAAGDRRGPGKFDFSDWSARGASATLEAIPFDRGSHVMLRSRLLVSVATPLFAASLLLPSAAMASPYARSVPLLGMQDPGGESLAQPVPGQTPAAPVNTQVQAPGAQSQDTPGAAGPQSQSQTLAAPGSPPLNVPPGSTVMQPQIQVLVQPQIQVQAQPQGNASPTSSADITTNTNSTATPTVTTNTKTTPPPAAPVYVAPPQQRYPHTRYAPPPPPPRIVTRVVSRPSHAAPAPIKRPPPPRKGLMVTGWVLFGVSYLITASNAADLYDRCPNMNKPGRCRDLAENMFIPVVGPFLAMEQAKFATDDFSLAVSGSLQGLGLVMGIVGTVQYHRDKYRNRVLNEYGVRVAKNTSVNAGSRIGGGQVTLTARF